MWNDDKHSAGLGVDRVEALVAEKGEQRGDEQRHDKERDAEGVAAWYQIARVRERARRCPGEGALHKCQRTQPP
ncbi:hypothetical protein WI73_31980 [Burkholderia ubonensis]|nr:hypothetical protein WI73_31980 [Burkholderia ubonensis]